MSHRGRVARDVGCGAEDCAILHWANKENYKPGSKRIPVSNKGKLKTAKGEGLDLSFKRFSEITKLP